MGQLTNEICECEKETRAFRVEAIIAGRLDLARQFLRTPVELKDLAEFLWYGRALVTLEKTTKAEAAPINQRFPKKFGMRRSDGRPFAKARADTFLSCFDALTPVIATKIKSDVLDRCNSARRHGKIISKPQMIRELAIETAPWRYPLEEWATIFPDAALAGDYDFVKRVVDRCTEPPQVLDLQYWGIAFSWPGFEWLGLANRVPPLKHWRDKAACEFAAWWSGDDSITIDAYKARKKKLGLRSEKLKLVMSAKYTRRGKLHLLVCER
jgi:hypothetical protein